MHTPYNIDVSGRVNAIEGLKSQLLTDVANLYSMMANRRDLPIEQFGDLFSDIMIITYLLSKQMGHDYQEMDHIIAKKLKYHLIEDDDKENWSKDLRDLLSHVSRKRVG